MGKVSVTVLSCNLHRTRSLMGPVNPSVQIKVDGKYMFRTKTKRNDRRPTFLETFVVGNTHWMATIEVVVLHRDEPHGEEREVGKCWASLRRLCRGTEKVREHLLVTPEIPRVTTLDSSSAHPILLAECNSSSKAPVIGFGGAASGASPAVFAPAGSTSQQDSAVSYVVAGSVVISLYSDDLGDYDLSLNTQVEEEYTRRLRNLCHVYDTSLLGKIDVLVGDVREHFEQPSRSGAHQGRSPGGGVGASNASRTSEYGTTFAEVVQRLVERYGQEKQAHRLYVEVEGATGLVELVSDSSSTDDGPPSRSPNPFIVVGSGLEQYETNIVMATDQPRYSSAATYLTVLNPEDFALDVVVMSSSTGSAAFGDIEIGRGCVTAHCLPQGGLSHERMVPVVRDGVVTGNVMLRLTAVDFGSIAGSEHIDVAAHIKQLTRYLIRYEPNALPLVDLLVQKQQCVWGHFMLDLIQHYGREPGSAVLDIVVRSVFITDELASESGLATSDPIYVALSMGSTHLKSKRLLYNVAQETVVEEMFAIDIARETDEIHVEVLHGTTHVVVGVVHALMIGLQRGAHHERDYALVNNAGTRHARLGGVVRLMMKCDALGIDHAVDHEYEVYFRQRLLRFCEVYLRQKLHRVDIAVATTDDVEGFLESLSHEHGPEPASQRVAVTVEGIRQIGSRYSGVPLMVVIEAGIERHSSRVARASKDPEFHETLSIEVPVASPGYTKVAGRQVRLKVVTAHAAVPILIATATVTLPPPTNNTEQSADGSVSSTSAAAALQTEWMALHYYSAEDAASLRGLIGVSCFTRPVEIHSAITHHIGEHSHHSSTSRRIRRGPLTLSPIVVTSADDDMNYSLRRAARSVETMDGESPQLLNTSRSSGPYAGYPPKTPSLSMMGKSVWVMLEDLSELPPVCGKAAVQQPSTILVISVYLAEAASLRLEDDKTRLESPQEQQLVFAAEIADYASSTIKVRKSFDVYPACTATQVLRVKLDAILERQEVAAISTNDVATFETSTASSFYHNKSKRRVVQIGECVLSLQHVPPWPVERSKKLPIVQRMGTTSAVVRGSLLATMQVRYVAEVGSTPLLPLSASRSQAVMHPSQQHQQSTELAEARARQSAVAFLAQRAPQELHLADIYVTEDVFVEETHVLSKLQQRWAAAHSTKDKSSDGGVVVVTIKDLRLLVDGRSSDSSVPFSSCYIKVKVGREKFSTPTVALPSGGHTASTVVEFNSTFFVRHAGDASGVHKETGDADTSLEDMPLMISHTDDLQLQLRTGGPFGRVHGEVFVSCAYLQRHVIKERTFALVKVPPKRHAGSDAVMSTDMWGLPCGFVTIQLYSDVVGQREALDAHQELALSLRVRSMLQTYQPWDVHRTDLIVGPNMASREPLTSVMRTLADRLGPEPGHHIVQVTIGACRNTVKTDTTGGHSRPFFVLRIGGFQFQTRTQHAIGAEFDVRESFTFDVGLPEQDYLTLFLLDETSSVLSRATPKPNSEAKGPAKVLHGSTVVMHRGVEATESGRVLVSLAFARRGVATRRLLPLVLRAGTSDAVVYGTVEVTLLTQDFGLTSPPQLSDDEFANVQQRVIRILSRYDAAHLHCFDVIMGKFINREAELLSELVKKYGAEPGSFPLALRIIGLRLPAASACTANRHADFCMSGSATYLGGRETYLSPMAHGGSTEPPSNPIAINVLEVKLFNNGVQILKTKPFEVNKGSDVFSLQPDDNASITTEVSDIAESVFTFQVNARGFFKKSTLASADMGVRDLVKDFPNVRWLRLFDPVSGVFFGSLGVEARSIIFGLVSSRRDEELCEDAALDVVSLMRKYQPADLRGLDVAMERAPSLAQCHSKLRQKYRPNACGTIYVVVHNVQLVLQRRKPTVPEHYGAPLTLLSDKKKRQKKGTEKAVEEPELWHKGEQYKDIICVGSLCGEVVKCRGRCSPEGSAVGAHSRSSSSTVGLLRFDVALKPGSNSDATLWDDNEEDQQQSSGAPYLSLSVLEVREKDCNITLGCVEVSIKAALTPEVGLLGMEERISVPLVLVQQTSSAVDAFVTGVITLSFMKPSFETVPRRLKYHSVVHDTVDAGFVLHYYERVQRMLRCYDPALLLGLHRTFFDMEVGGCRSKERLPALLQQLIDQWGPEPPSDQ